MPTLNLDDYFKSKKESFEVRMGDKTYALPLGEDLSIEDYSLLSEVQKTNDPKLMFKFLENYMGDVVRTLPIGAVKTIIQGWVSASNGATGDLTSGES